MITFSIKLTILICTNIIIFIKNPVKIRIILIILRLTIFFLIYLRSGIVWFPILFSLLFIGGILIIFIILSSILPNEKRTKIHIMRTIILSNLILFTQHSKIEESLITGKFIKRFLSRNNSFNLLILILILYFFSTITILCKVELPIRSVTCCKIK